VKIYFFETSHHCLFSDTNVSNNKIRHSVSKLFSSVTVTAVYSLELISLSQTALHNANPNYADEMTPLQPAMPSPEWQNPSGELRQSIHSMNQSEAEQ